MTVKERLIDYIKFKHISVREFCRKIGVSETYVNSMRSSIQPDKLVKISHEFPDLNTEWLLTGEGEMMRKRDVLPPIEKSDLINVSADVFKDKLIDMFQKGEIFSASIVWEQHRLIIEQSNKIEQLRKENESLRIKLAQNGIDVQ